LRICGFFTAEIAEHAENFHIFPILAGRRQPNPEKDLCVAGARV